MAMQTRYCPRCRERMAFRTFGDSEADNYPIPAMWACRACNTRYTIQEYSHEYYTIRREYADLEEAARGI